jgi:hypothetical protein
VLFQRDGKLYEVSAGHCSCYGLEGRWEPDEVTWDQLAMRFNDKTEFYCDGSAKADAAIKQLITQHVPRA